MPAPLEISRPDSTTPSQASLLDTRQAIPLPPRPWTKFIAAFAGGVACTFLLTTFITTFSSTPRKPEPETAKVAQRTQGRQPAKSAPTPSPAAKASDPAPHAQDVASDRTPASEDPSGAQPERGAPSTLTTTAPAQPPTRPTVRTTDDSASPDARTAIGSPSGETTGSSS